MKKRQHLLNQPTGVQPWRACRIDRRFSYSVYVPESLRSETAPAHRFLVAMHGTIRGAETARDMFIDLAEETQSLVLAPLFPMAVTDQEEMHNYFWLKYEGIRYDEILFAMLDEASQRFGVSAEQFALTGFSGGGQFAHRMLYLHPNRLTAVSIGAPGMVTLIDDSKDWFVGTRDFEAHFGKPLDLEAIKRVPIHIVVGSEDTHGEINVEPGTSLYMPGVNDTGNTRVERARCLHQRFGELGIKSQFDIVPGATHAPKEVLLAVESFLRNASRPTAQDPRSNRL